jgi:hypothetical protein
LHDTADNVGSMPRTPTNTEFIPVGHIALESKPEADQKLELPKSGVYWVVSVYVSWAIQSGGLGRSAMRQLESVATKEPLKAKLLVLDTAAAHFQFDPQVLKALYTDRGIPVPPVSLPSHPLLNMNSMSHKRRM